jgi:hypothetical protein
MAEERQSRSIALQYHADRLLFDPSGQRLLVISNEDQSAFLINLESGAVEARYGYDIPGFSVTDASIAPGGRYAYLVGQQSLGMGFVIRLDLATLTGSHAQFSEKSLNPSIAVSEGEKLAIGRRPCCKYDGCDGSSFRQS